jgi:hypothetical protein
MPCKERGQRPRHKPLRLSCSFPDCVRSFRNQGGLTKHIRSHHSSHYRSRRRSPPSRSLLAHPEVQHSPEIHANDGSEALTGSPNLPYSPAQIPNQYSPPLFSSPNGLLPSDDIQRSPSRTTEPDPSLAEPSTHQLLNGLYFIDLSLSFLILIYFIGQPCDEHGNYLPADAPPQQTRHAHANPNDWTPYRDRVEFETAQFLYCQAQMSAGNINTLLDLWAATLVKHDEPPPFANAADLYETIDSTPLGDIPWQSFSVTYDGDAPDPAPQWMSTEYEVWFRDPRLVVRNMVDNPDYKDGFDTTPIRVFDIGDYRQYQNFMSGDWAWNEAVRFNICFKHVSEVQLIPGYNI